MIGNKRTQMPNVRTEITTNLQIAWRFLRKKFSFRSGALGSSVAADKLSISVLIPIGHRPLEKVLYRWIEFFCKQLPMRTTIDHQLFRRQKLVGQRMSNRSVRIHKISREGCAVRAGR